MKKEEIEKIMLEEAEKLGIVLIDESGLGKKHLYNCLARIDAERGKEAIGTLCISHFMNDPGMENMEFQPSKSLAPGQYPLLLSPTIPEGMALVPIEPTCPACGGTGVIKTYDNSGLVDQFGCDLCGSEDDQRELFEEWMAKRGTPLCLEQTQAYEAFQAGMLAAAQGERDAD